LKTNQAQQVLHNNVIVMRYATCTFVTCKQYFTRPFSF